MLADHDCHRQEYRDKEELRKARVISKESETLYAADYVVQISFCDLASDRGLKNTYYAGVLTFAPHVRC